MSSVIGRLIRRPPDHQVAGSLVRLIRRSFKYYYGKQ